MRFRPIISLSAFTTLKSIKLCWKSIGVFAELGDAPVNDMTREEIDTHFAACLEKRKDVLVNLLPCKSLEFLQLDGLFTWAQTAVVELARRASRGEFPNLKHVRLSGGYGRSLDVAKWDMCEDGKKLAENDLARYHDLKSTVPEKYRDEAKVERVMNDPDMECEARQLFLAAGVLFERLCVTWPVRADTESSFDDRWMRAYPKAGAGDCGNPDCIVVKSTPC